ncbi:MAG TPA: STAS domain-containing protein [Terriglobales bacterium]|nr:STAS domain-containing protein [Terriglobales bacterium]
MANNEFSVTIRNGIHPGCAILSVSGPLVLEHLVAFQEIWDSHPEPTLVLDVSDLSYIDSAAIGFLVNAYVTREKSGKKLALAGVHGMAQRILTVTRVGQLLKMYDTVEEAEKALYRQSAAS